MNPDLYQELVRQISSLQKQIDALIKPEVGRWMTWTPTVSQGGNVARTINYAKYTLSNGNALASVSLTFTAAGTAGNTIEIAGIPTIIQPLTTGLLVGAALYFDSGTAFYHGAVYSTGANNFRIYCHNAVDVLGLSPAITIAINDILWLDLSYPI